MSRHIIFLIFLMTGSVAANADTNTNGFKQQQIASESPEGDVNSCIWKETSDIKVIEKNYRKVVKVYVAVTRVLFPSQAKQYPLATVVDKGPYWEIHQSAKGSVASVITGIVDGVVDQRFEGGQGEGPIVMEIEKCSGAIRIRMRS